MENGPVKTGISLAFHPVVPASPAALLDFCNWLLESIDNLGLGRDGNLRPDLPHL
jgi:hypothetical protein